MFRYLLLLLFCLLPLLAQAADTRGLRVVAKDPATNQTAEVKLYNKSYAVVIGIDQYQNLPPDRQLNNAVHDAKGIADVLKRNFRFDKIVTLYDKQATKDRILELLTEELPRKMGSEDSVFIFWAGHGNQEESAEGDIGYLIPYDGDTYKIRKNITMTEIRDTISKKIPAKHVLYVMDACYSGLLTTRSVDTSSRRDLAYIKSITKERVRQVLTAGSKGEEVLDGGPKGHSVFTGRLIEALEAAGDFITANEIQAILKEKVYGDARGRGKAQTPSFGALYGSGDYVFVPNMQQKVQDNKAELARIEAELKRLEAREADAKRYRSEQQQREAEQQRKAAEARLRAEQLRQQQLQEEAKRQQELVAERLHLEAEQKKKEQELNAARRNEEQRLAALKAELAKKKQTAPAAASGSLAAAVAEINRLNAEISGIEATFNVELAAGKSRITARYNNEITAIRQASKQPDVPLVRDEFETASEFKTRQAKHEQRFEERIKQLQLQQDQELAELKNRIDAAQQEQTKELRLAMQQLANKPFTVGMDSLVAELGAYDADKQQFAVSIRSKIPEIKLAMNGTIPLPRNAARTFKQQWQAGAVWPQVVAKAGTGELQRVVLLNDGVKHDADDYLLEYVDGEFLSVVGRKQRQLSGQLVAVPSGCFSVEGSQVCLDGFMIGKHEVTQGQWKMVMGSSPSHFSSCGDNCPVEEVSWDDAQQFISKLNRMTGKRYRLPTETEWEYACRAGGTEEYCGSNSVDAVAWYKDNSGGETHPVGLKAANAWGIHDMSGNVWEWCQDWYGSRYPSGTKNPTGVSSGSHRVNRGGGWDFVAGYVRSADRFRDVPGFRDYNLGFRLVLPSVQ